MELKVKADSVLKKYGTEDLCQLWSALWFKLENANDILISAYAMGWHGNGLLIRSRMIFETNPLDYLKKFWETDLCQVSFCGYYFKHYNKILFRMRDSLSMSMLRLLSNIGEI